MAIDIRATVTCTLGTLISGSLSDDYIQGSGLVKTRGTVEISGTITPAIGTAVTISYTKAGTTRTIPRKLRVLSSFADPFRRTTSVELGCKLTYLSDLQEPVNWDALDDPENSAYDTETTRIVTLPIHASSVMNQCLTKLGITASSNPLTNKFSVASFDFGPGYVQVLNDLLVSECYFGYLDTNEVLQVVDLNAASTITGPVYTAADIADLGAINSGQLPGEAVTVSYSSLRLKSPESADEDLLNWETEETIGAVEKITVQYTRDAVPDTRFYTTWTYLPRTITNTFYDDWDRVTKRVTTDYYIGAAVNTQFYVDCQKVGTPITGQYERSAQQTVTTETFNYKKPAKGTKPTDDPDVDIVTRSERVVSEPWMSLAGDVAGSFINEDGDGIVNFMPIPGNFTAERTTTLYETYTTTENNYSIPITKTTTNSLIPYGRTQHGQQEIARQLEAGGTVSEAITNAANLINRGISTSIAKGRGVGLQERPSAADRTNAALNKGGDPNNGWRTESSSELVLALGSATAQRRIELSMPYAPDDTFTETSPGVFASAASDAKTKATNYGRIQNRLLLGNRSGMNLQLAPERLPTAPFAPMYVQANGLTAQYRANGNQWAFDGEGIVCSTDALFWAAVAGTGTFWFPVAPGITTLPSTPPTINGQITPTSTTPPYNETVKLDAAITVGYSVTKLNYALALSTQVPALVVKVKARTRALTTIETPAKYITLNTHIPTVFAVTQVSIPAAAITVSAIAPEVFADKLINVPSYSINLNALTPAQAGGNATEVTIPLSTIAVTSSVPSVAIGIPWTPEEITTEMWLDASNSSTVTVVSGAVSQWDDLSGNGYNATQTSAGSRPTYTSSAINNLNAIEFDGTGKYLEHTLNASPAPHTVFAVVKRKSGGSTGYQLVLSAISPNSAFGVNISALRSGSTDWGSFVGGWQGSGEALTLDTTYIIGIVSPTSGSEIYRTNGNEVTVSFNSRYGGDSNNRRYIGYDASFGSGELSGQIGELLVLTSAANQATSEKIEGYLAHKWGLTGSLPSGHPYKTVPPFV